MRDVCISAMAVRQLDSQMGMQARSSDYISFISFMLLILS